MGVSQQNETKFLFRFNNNQLIPTRIFTKFEKEKFAEGTFRYCYRGDIYDLDEDEKVKTVDFPSGKCVVKVYKSDEHKEDFILDYKNSEYASQCAAEFNSIIGENKLYFILPFAGSINIVAGFKLFGLFNIRDDENKKFVKENSLVSIEPYLPYEYYKFSSNSGYENQSFNRYIPAFMHYTWIKSRGRIVVSDVQGIFTGDKYILTDPACQSLNQIFGSSDLGAMGLCKFLVCHRHNEYCKNWIWLPPQFNGILSSVNANSIKRTSFVFEHNKNIQKYVPIYNYVLSLIKFNN